MILTTLVSTRKGPSYRYLLRQIILVKIIAFVQKPFHWVVFGQFVSHTVADFVMYWWFCDTSGCTAVRYLVVTQCVAWPLDSHSTPPLLQSECKTTSVIYTKPTNACWLIILEFREAFKIFDVDNSQTITTDELLLVMKNLGMMATKDEVKDMLSEVDEDGMLPGNEKGWGVG